MLFGQWDKNYFSRMSDRNVFTSSGFSAFTFDHSIIHAKQKGCSQFAGMPTSCSVKFSIQMAHCSLTDGGDEGAGAGGSDEVIDSDTLPFCSCSRCRDRVVWLEE